MNFGDPLEGQVLGFSLVFFLLTASAPAGSSEGVPPADGDARWPKVGRQIRSYHHLEGDIRWRQLYSSTHFFLSIDGRGKVEGKRRKDRLDTILEIRSVKVGVVAIRSVHSGYYLAMNRKGRLYGTKVYSPNCKFKERIEENGYNTYSSFHWRHNGRPMFLALSRKGVPQCGANTRWQQRATHFLPLIVF